jgi:hypothetical protein
LRSAERLLLDNPHIGRPLHRPGIRRLTLSRTPFFLVYRVTERQIEILRLIGGCAFDTLLDDRPAPSFILAETLSGRRGAPPTGGEKRLAANGPLCRIPLSSTAQGNRI